MGTINTYVEKKQIEFVRALLQTNKPVVIIVMLYRVPGSVHLCMHLQHIGTIHAGGS